MSEPEVTDAAVEQKLRAFIHAIKKSETYQKFIEASEDLEDDTDAMALLDEYQQKQRQMQQGGFDQSIMSELQELQTEISNNETINQHQAAQKELVDLLQQTNTVISESLGREFAQSTGGGCC